MYNLKFTLKYKDKVDFYLFISDKRMDKKSSMVSFIIQMIPITFILNIISVDDNSSIRLIGFFIVILFFTWLFYNLFNSNKRYRKAYERLMKDKDDEKITISIDKKEVRLISETIEEKYKWIIIDEVIEKKDFIYIVTRNSGGIIIPKKEIKKEIIIPEMILFINNQIKKNSKSLKLLNN